MATEKQIAANRRNAQRSTGPKTPEGKAASRLNALKHGLVAEDAVVPVEDERAFNELRNSILDHLQPVGPLETTLVHQIAVAQRRLAVCRKLETGYFRVRLDDAEKPAHIFCRGAGIAPKAFDTLSRYQTRIERAFFRDLHELQRLQAARHSSANTANPAPAALRAQL
jgi:hypothetical protein